MSLDLLYTKWSFHAEPNLSFMLPNLGRSEEQESFLYCWITPIPPMLWNQLCSVSYMQEVSLITGQM